MRKPTKTISGVAPLSVMLPPRKCDHGTCLYCPTYGTSDNNPPISNLQSPILAGAPQSYTPESPAVLRAKQCNYNPAKQVKARLKAFNAMGHPTDKIELIIMGGTFLSYPKKFQFQFIKSCYDALNNKKTKSIEQAKKTNETAKHRCTALCIETRPDVCTPHHIKNMLEWGTTRIELGVQAIDDEIYKKVNRGHKVQDVIDATKRLKQAGFKIGYHLMPGIPGSTPKKDIQMFKKIFSSKNFKPDQIKIYPCQVLKGSGIENLYYGGEYIPYTKQQTTEIIIQMLKLTPRYCRIMRIMREIPLTYLIAGIKNIDMRKDIEEKIRESENLSHERSSHGSPKKVSLLCSSRSMPNGRKGNFSFLKRKKSIKEIRFREIGFAMRDNRKIDSKIKIKTKKYKASGGTEFFIEAVNKDNILFGLCRLRLDNNATVRELHVYGPALKLRATSHKPQAVQHSGLGKLLLKKAEQLAKKHKHKSIKIISGVGVREYYKNQGYKLDKQKIYMIKKFKPSQH